MQVVFSAEIRQAFISKNIKLQMTSSKKYLYIVAPEREYLVGS